MLTALMAMLPAFGGELTEPKKRAKIERMYNSYRNLGFQKVPEVRPTEVGQLEDPLYVDVRPEEERVVSYIPGSIDKQTFESNPQAYAGRTIVTYCTIGARSGLYAKKLVKNGWDAHNLAGSLLLWTHAGLPLQDEAGPTYKVHTYGKRWALVAEGYEAVW